MCASSFERANLQQRAPQKERLFALTIGARPRHHRPVPSYRHPRPAVTADVVVFSMRADDLAVLLIRRNDAPFKGAWALPGGFVDANESLERAAARELYEETGVNRVRLRQLGAFGDPGRDPRGHTVTVAYYTCVVAESTKVKAGDDAADADWKSLGDIDLSPPEPPTAKKRGAKKAPTKRARNAKVALAFDHGKIISDAVDRLRAHLTHEPWSLPFKLVPPRFTLAELKRVYEVVFGARIERRTFRSRMTARGLITRATEGEGRAQLYRWNAR